MKQQMRYEQVVRENPQIEIISINNSVNITKSDGLKTAFDIVLESNTDLQEFKLSEYIIKEYDEENNYLKVEILPFKLKNEFFLHSYSLKLNCQIPTHSRLKVNNKNGRIRVDSLDLHMELANKNGSIKLIDISGEAIVSNKNGSIKVENSLLNKCIIGDRNGSIVYHFNKDVEQGSFEFTNKNGSITLYIPPSLPYDISGQTRIGSYHINLDQEYKKEDGKIYIHNKDGKVKIRIDNNIGGIKLFSTDKPEGIDVKVISAYWDKTEKIGETIKESMLRLEEDIKNMSERFKDEEWNQIKEQIKDMKENIVNFVHSSKGKVNLKLDKVFDKFGDMFQYMGDKSKKQENIELKKKVLDMLENGKITAEEAERLLRSI
ncbi:MAG: hypothetical protein DRH57_01430 [Candidatus Cloacimonadota bacterium]|nr:MAG: hypothetical protein DRH57_01430 [Candidatus Cloacimonadota bacterium]